MNRDCRRLAASNRRTLAEPPPARRPSFAVVQTHPRGSAQLLREALERNAEWIGSYIEIADAGQAVLAEYLEWFFDRLKDRVPSDATDEALDRLIRAEVRSIYRRLKFRRGAPPWLAEVPDPEGERFEEDLARRSELNDFLDHLAPEVRGIVEAAYSMSEEEFSRDELAKRLGIKRNTLDQRISRALKALRSRKRT